MPYKDEHRPWVPGAIVFPVEGYVKSRDASDKTVMLPRNAAIACILADDCLVKTYIRHSPFVEDAVKLDNEEGNLSSCYKALLQDNKNVITYLNHLYKIGKLINADIDKRRKRVD